MKPLPLTQKQIHPALLADLEKLNTILIDHGAAKVILYGSLARGDFREHSDIDLCVAGMPERNYFRALAACMMHVRRQFSILDLDRAYGYFRERVLAEGKVLYERA